jgi:PAS domain S-box-containing protein
MKIQTKVVVLTLILIVLFTGIVIISKLMQDERETFLFQERAREKGELLSKVVEFKGASLQNMTYDYSFWDEMVDFVRTRDEKWAFDNIKMALPTFKVTSAWVYDLNFSVLYNTDGPDSMNIRELPLSAGEFRQIFDQNPFPHFYINTSVGLIEIRGAPIRPTADVERKSPPRGYFLVGLLWNFEFVKELSGLMEGPIMVVPPGNRETETLAPLRGGVIIDFSRELPGWDGKTVALLIGHTESRIILEMNHIAQVRLFEIILLALTVTLILAFLLLRWVSSPLKLLSRSLKEGDPSILSKMRKNNSEFGHLAQLITKFFGQNEELVQEVTERTLAEKTVRENEKFLRVLLDSIKAGIFVVDAQTHKIVDANLMALELIGVPKEEMIGRDCHCFICPAERGKCPVTDLRKTVDSSEKEIKRADGKIIPVLKSVVAVKRLDRHFLIESFFDISESKKAEKELRESSEKVARLAAEQRILLENTRDFIYRHDTQGVFYYLSPSVFQVSGYSVEEWCTHYTTYMTDCPKNQIVISNTDETLRTGKINPPYLVEILHKQGHKIQLEVNEQPYFEDGKVAGIVGIARDVTERIMVEEQLKQSEEKYRNLIENMLDGVVILDPDENIIFANPAAGHIFGACHEELIGVNVRQVVTEEEMDKLLKELKKRKQKNSSKYELSIKGKDGNSRRIFIAANPMLNNEGNVVGTLAVFSDITDLRKAEKEKLELQDKLDRAQRMESLGILAGGVAHDLNNILGPLVAYPELILTKLPEESPLRKQVTIMGRSAKEAAEVIQDLLSLARRGRYEMTSINLNSVIEDYMESPSYLGQISRNINLKIIKRLEPEINMLNGSSSHLLKVVMNLIINAIDAMPNGGILTIETSQTYLEKLLSGYERIPKGEYIILRVSDTGIGIDKKDLKKIFEPYFSTKKIGSSGSGLGLSVVYGIVKDHKGYYDVFSEVGCGTEFVLYFPAVKVDRNIRIEDSDIYSGHETVLIVDDLEDQRELASQIISSMGYRVDTVAGGREAVQYLIERPIDIVVLDMIMEKDFDGYDTYSEIIKHRPGQKAIIVSGYSATERVNQMQALGAGNFVKKPYSRETIARALKEELDKGRTAVTPAVQSPE